MYHALPFGGDKLSVRKAELTEMMLKLSRISEKKKEKRKKERLNWNLYYRCCLIRVLYNIPFHMNFILRLLYPRIPFAFLNYNDIVADDDKILDAK